MEGEVAANSGGFVVAVRVMLGQGSRSLLFRVQGQCYSRFEVNDYSRSRMIMNVQS